MPRFSSGTKKIPKNLFVRLFLPQNLFLFSKVIFGDRPKIPYKSHKNNLARLFLFFEDIFRLTRLFLKNSLKRFLGIRQQKRAQRLTFWVRRPPGGVGVFHAKGWWPKVRALPRKFVFLGFRREEPGMSQEFARMFWTLGVLNGVQKVCAIKKVRAHFSFPRKGQGQVSAEGILHLVNPNLGSNSGMRILKPRIFGAKFWGHFFGPYVFQ